MTSKHKTVSAFALAAALSTAMFAQAKPAATNSAAPAAAPAATALAPRMVVDEPVKDFGTVPKGQRLNWSFTVKNNGSSDLEILSAQPGCGCTVAEFDKVIKPGTSGKVEAHVDTTQFSGPISKFVTVQTNDPATPSMQLTIHAVVKPYVDASPAGFVRFTMLQGETKSQSVQLFSEEEAPFEVTTVDSPVDWIKAEVKKVDKDADRVKGGRDGQNQFVITVTAGGPKATPGPIAQKLVVHTNSKNQPEFQIAVSGVIRPAFSVAPSVLNFGETAPGDAASARNVVVSSNDKVHADAFKVIKVESTAKGTIATLKPSTQAGEYEVEVKLGKTAKAGALAGDLKIYTNDKNNPVITVPVSGTVKSAAKK